MPNYLDISSGVSGLAGQRNMQQAQRQDTGARQQNMVLGGIEQGAQGLHRWAAEQKKQEDEKKALAAVQSIATKEYDIAPDDPILQDPIALAARLDQLHADRGVKSHEEFLRKRDEAQFQHADAAQQNAFGHAERMQGIGPMGYDPSADPQVGAARSLADYQRESAERQSRMVGSEEGELLAPVGGTARIPSVVGLPQGVPALGTGVDFERPAGILDVARRATQKPGGYTSEALGGAFSRAQKPEKPGTPHNIDPRSPEGIEAELELERRKKALNPQKPELDPEDRAYKETRGRKRAEGEFPRAQSSWGGQDSAQAAGLRARATRADDQLRSMEEAGPPLDEDERRLRERLRATSEKLWAEHDKLTGRTKAEGDNLADDSFLNTLPADQQAAAKADYAKMTDEQKRAARASLGGAR